MRTGANILWVVLGGWVEALCWYLTALLMAVTVIGLPWCRACWELGTLSLVPFGREAVSRAALIDERPSGWALLGNLLWLPLGLFLAVSHALHGALLCLTLILIPFGLQHFKLAGLALFPVGKRVVSKEAAQMLRQEGARREIARHRAGAPPLIQALPPLLGAGTPPPLTGNGPPPLTARR